MHLGEPGNRPRLGWRWFVTGVIALLLAVASRAQPAAPPDEIPAPDDWLESAEALPPTAAGPAGTSQPFDSLGAVVEGNRMAVRWLNRGAPLGAATAFVSTDEPGHWPVRDWRPWPMTSTRTDEGEWWVARVPLLSATVPNVYCVRAGMNEVSERSRLRVFRPDRAGLKDVPAPFLGYLEGFEEGLTGWEGPAGPGQEAMLGRSTNALTGRWALRIEVPPGRGSVVVGTVRIRGWMLRDFGVTAVRLAVRTEVGEGRLRLALHSAARTDRLAVHPVVDEPQVGPRWRRLEVPLGAFRGLRRGAVDWFTVQLVAESGRALLLDDVELELR